MDLRSVTAPETLMRWAPASFALGGLSLLPWRSYGSTIASYGCEFSTPFRHSRIQEATDRRTQNFRPFAWNKFRWATVSIIERTEGAHSSGRTGQPDFGSFHWNYLRKAFVELRYRFSY